MNSRGATDLKALFSVSLSLGESGGRAMDETFYDETFSTKINSKSSNWSKRHCPLCSYSGTSFMVL